MRLTIVAATGGIGRELLRQAIAAGHDVTAVVRDPSKITAPVRVVRADLAHADPAALADAVKGADAVLSGLGARFARTAFRTHYADLARMEDVVRSSGLDWTVSRPPKLTDKPLTGHYRTALGQNVRGGFSIPRADVAHQMLDCLAHPETIGQIVGLAT